MTLVVSDSPRGDAEGCGDGSPRRVRIVTRCRFPRGGRKSMTAAREAVLGADLRAADRSDLLTEWPPGPRAFRCRRRTVLASPTAGTRTGQVVHRLWTTLPGSSSDPAASPSPPGPGRAPAATGPRSRAGRSRT